MSSRIVSVPSFAVSARRTVDRARTGACGRRGRRRDVVGRARVEVEQPAVGRLGGRRCGHGTDGAGDRDVVEHAAVHAPGTSRRRPLGEDRRQVRRRRSGGSRRSSPSPARRRTGTRPTPGRPAPAAATIVSSVTPARGSARSRRTVPLRSWWNWKNDSRRPMLMFSPGAPTTISSVGVTSVPGEHEVEEATTARYRRVRRRPCGRRAR